MIETEIRELERLLNLDDCLLPPTSAWEAHQLVKIHSLIKVMRSRGWSIEIYMPSSSHNWWHCRVFNDDIYSAHRGEGIESVVRAMTAALLSEKEDRAQEGS